MDVNSLRVFVIVALITVASSAAFATPITYQESVSGDLPSGGGSTLLFDFGTNTVSGNLSWFAVADLDFFKFAVPTGGTLTSIDLSFVTTASASGGVINWDLTDQTPMPTFLGTQGIGLIGSGFSLPFFAGLLPRTSDTYGIASSFSVSGTPSLQNGFSTDYTWRINVASVPDVASTFGLLGFVCAGLGAATRLRQRA